MTVCMAVLNMQKEIRSFRITGNSLKRERDDAPNLCQSLQRDKCHDKGEKKDLLKTLQMQQERMHGIEDLVRQNKDSAKKTEALAESNRCSYDKFVTQLKSNICNAPSVHIPLKPKQKGDYWHDCIHESYGSISENVRSDNVYLQLKMKGYERLIKNLCNEHNAHATNLMELVKKKEAEIDDLRLKRRDKSGFSHAAVEAEVSLLKEMIERCRSLLREGEKTSKRKDKIIRKLRKELLFTKEKKQEYKRSALDSISRNSTKIMNANITADGRETPHASKRTIAYFREQWNAMATEVQTLKTRLASEEERAANAAITAKEQIQLKDKLINCLNMKLKQLVHKTLKSECEFKKMSSSMSCEGELERFPNEAMKAHQNEKDMGLELSKLREENRSLYNYVRHFKDKIEAKEEEFAEEQALVIDVNSKDLQFGEYQNMIDLEKTDLVKKVIDLRKQVLMKTTEINKLNKDLEVAKNNTAKVEYQEKRLKGKEITPQRRWSENRDKEIEMTRLLKQQNLAEDNLEVKMAEFNKIKVLLDDTKVRFSDAERQLETYKKKNAGLSKKISELTANLKTIKRTLLKKNKECFNLERKHRDMVNQIEALIPKNIVDQGMDIVSTVERTFQQMAQEGADTRNDIEMGEVNNRNGLVPFGSDKLILPNISPKHTSNPNNFDIKFSKEEPTGISVKVKELDDDLLLVSVDSASSSGLHIGQEDSELSLQSIESSSLIGEGTASVRLQGEGMSSSEMLDIIDSEDGDDRKIPDNGEDSDEDIVILQNIVEDEELMNNESQSMHKGFSDTYWPTWFPAWENNGHKKDSSKTKDGGKRTCDAPMPGPIPGSYNTENVNVDVTDGGDIDFCDINVEDIIEI